jgi:eukaryotic-like serine/threonine-protein kinase
MQLSFFGFTLLQRNLMQESLQLFEIVLDCQRRRHGPLHEDVAAALHNVGIANVRMERHEKALQAFEEAVRLRKGSLGRDHPHVAVSTAALVRVHSVIRPSFC